MSRLIAKYHLLVAAVLVTGTVLSSQGTGERAERKNTEPVCVDCHRDMINRGVTHPVAEDGCENCHLSNGNPHPLEDTSGFTLMDSVPALCYYCHAEPEEVSHPHAPVKASDCLTCHDVHSSPEFRLLRQPEVELCSSCHSEPGAMQSETSRLRSGGSGSRVWHTAVSTGGCIVCHLPHGSDLRDMLVAYYPQDTYAPAEEDNFALCFLCHDSELLNAEETEWGTGFRNGTRNLHRLHINGSKGRNCRLCHNLHQSDLPFLLEETVRFGNWEMNIGFTLEENGGSCLPGCHERLNYDRE